MSPSPSRPVPAQQARVLPPTSPAGRRTSRIAMLAVPLLSAATFATLPVGSAGAAVPAPTPHSQLFSDTGTAQYFTVPQRVTSLTFTLDGGSGGSGESTSLNTFPGAGGLGGRVVETLPVYAGQRLRIGVGAAGQDAGAPYGAGSGGYASGLTSNGGSGGYGDGTDMSTGGSGGGGGAATEVQLIGNEVIGLPDRTVAVAGGGGGGGGTGSIIGYNGGFGGLGGHPAQSGSGGTGPGAGGGGNGGASPNAYGDNGGSAPTASQAGGAGGGGGGYSPFGGGAGTGGVAGGAGEGGGGGGGGGQSFGESTATIFSQAPNRGNGDVTVAWSTPGVGQTITPSVNPALPGQTVVFTDTVTSSDPNGPAPTGTVALSRALGGMTYATGTLVPTGVATSQVKIPVTYPAGSLIGSLAYYFTYSGDTVYAANTSDQFVETLTHTVAVAGVTLNPGHLAFGTHPVDSTSTKTITIKSTGTAPLVVSSVKSSGAPVTVAGNTCAGKKLTPGQTCRITVRFHPTKRGSFSRTLAVVDNAPASPQRVTVTGGAG
jgi:hypothetical protein